ncbi:MAG: DNA replication and repair protein RecF [Bdellovibrionaceae bacterium]|nr:DNA replication and repair protein RecF [Pseudobdellovibrionaceae bacterium]
MAYKNLNLFHFRNIKNTEIKLEEGVNIFYGENGQGKTNLLEALFFLSRGRSFRTTEPSRCISMFKEESFSESNVALIKSNYKDSLNVDNSLKVQIENNKKTFWINEKRTVSTKLSTFCPTVLFSPESLASIKEGPQERRNLIDDIIEQLPEYSKAVSQFRKILKTRNKVLGDVKREFKKESEVRDLLNSITDIFIKSALDLIELRIYFLDLLKPYAQTAVRYIFNSEDSFDFNYIISDVEIHEFEAEKIEDLLRKRAQELYISELSSGYSLIGPQKHDIQFIFNGKDSRYYCSQGQQRALIVALKIAEIFYRLERREESPVLLLDDVMSELDERKRDRLVDFLKDVKSQIIITTTEKSSSLEKIMGPHKQFYIEEGRISLL